MFRYLLISSKIYIWGRTEWKWIIDVKKRPTSLARCHLRDLPIHSYDRSSRRRALRSRGFEEDSSCRGIIPISNAFWNPLPRNKKRATMRQAPTTARDRPLALISVCSGIVACVLWVVLGCRAHLDPGRNRTTSKDTGNPILKFTTKCL